MITISVAFYPPESANEVGKRFGKLLPFPKFIEVDGPYMIPEMEGIQAITIYKYDRAKAAEANEAITRAHIPFYGVPGYRYSVKLAATVGTALKMMGLRRSKKAG
jgi:hypothetical protein